MRKTKLYQSCHASRPRSCRRSHRRRGITSACAEQTAANTSPHSSTTDHLRVCGADPGIVPVVPAYRGLPPRVRSRRVRGRHPEHAVGITSACAEQTKPNHQPTAANEDYLRVCGADHRFRLQPRHPWDYLRVCGADLVQTLDTLVGAGLPPRVRSRLIERKKNEIVRGITSACAEQTYTSRGQLALRGDYLRVCGADYPSRRNRSNNRGLPPRVRSRQLYFTVF